MEPRLLFCDNKKLAGLNIRMSYDENSTVDLWSNFMRRKKEISNPVSDELISLQLFDPGYDFSQVNPQATFEKWACMEVADFNHIPKGMSPLILPAGLYAVFTHYGGPARAMFSFNYIFGTWLPASGYQLENRPHFEVMGAKHKYNAPDSEEEIWIPVRLRAS